MLFFFRVFCFSVSRPRKSIPIFRRETLDLLKPGEAKRITGMIDRRGGTKNIPIVVLVVENSFFFFFFFLLLLLMTKKNVLGSPAKPLTHFFASPHLLFLFLSSSDRSQRSSIRAFHPLFPVFCLLRAPLPFQKGPICQGETRVKLEGSQIKRQGAPQLKKKKRPSGRSNFDPHRNSLGNTSALPLSLSPGQLSLQLPLRERA